jgi:hypothetical protein
VKIDRIDRDIQGFVLSRILRNPVNPAYIARRVEGFEGAAGGD